MKHKGIYTACLVMLFAASVQAQPVPIPDPLPPIDFAFSPSVPTSGNPVDLIVSGLWPNNCVPEGVNVFISNSTIELRLLLPGAIDCEEPECEPILSAFEFNVRVGPLAVGTYSVFVRVLSCRESSNSVAVGSFTVGIPTGEPNEPGAVDVGPGTCVVLLQDMAVGNTVLEAGRAGMVVCCESEDCTGRLLISWFFHTMSNDTTDDCFEDIPRAISPGSTMWVDPDRVPLGVCFDQCGIVRQSQNGCILFGTDDGATYNLLDDDWLPGVFGPGEDFDFGDRIRVQGLRSILRPAGIVFDCPEQTADIYSPVITPCVPAGDGDGCCAAGFEPGDRVRLLVNNPPDFSGRPAPGLPAGTLGTVLCCNSDDEDFTVYVSWDNFTGGFNMSFLCDTPPVSHPASSAWWVSCDDIVLLAGGGNGGNGNGNGQACPQDNLIIRFGDEGIRLFRDPDCPATPRTISGCVFATVTTNFRARLSLDIEPLPGFNGTWSGTITPNVVSAGQSNVLVCITSSGVNLAGIPAGGSARVAEVAILAVPE